MVAPVPPGESLRVLVVGDDPLARGGLVGLLTGAAGMTVAAQAAPGGLGDTPDCDVIVWDVGLDAAVGLGRLRERPADAAPVVVLLPDGAPAPEALGAGARAVLRRGGEPARLAAAVRAVPQGLLVVDEPFAGALHPPRPVERGGEGLSPREQEVLALLAEGLPNKLVADRLGISEHTAKFHVNALFDKLGATTRTEAVVRAVRRGWLAL